MLLLAEFCEKPFSQGTSPAWYQCLLTSQPRKSQSLGVRVPATQQVQELHGLTPQHYDSVPTADSQADYPLA